MIHATYQFYSNILGRMTRFHAVLPRPQSLFQQVDRAEAPKLKKCLWFFHGVGDCGEDVLLHTHIGDLADAHDMIVVLPDLENSFCLDSDAYMRYESYLLQELIPMTAEYLPISARRQDHFLGGISMGGYGAVRLGLLRPELAAKVVCLSGALDLPFAFRYCRVCQISLPPAFGRHTDFPAHPDWNIMTLLHSSDPAAAPAFWLCCGERDMLAQSSAAFVAQASECGLSAEFHPSSGEHDWEYWRSTLAPAIKWLVS